MNIQKETKIYTIIALLELITILAILTIPTASLMLLNPYFPLLIFSSMGLGTAMGIISKNIKQQHKN